MARDEELVFSTEGGDLRGREPAPHAEEVNPANITLVLRLEKKGRGGKAVTVIAGLPANADYARGLAKRLKAHCGVGGAVKDGPEGGPLMELQGDQRPRARQLLEGLGFTVKG